VRTDNLWQDYISEKEIFMQPSHWFYAFTQLPFLQVTKQYCSLWSLKWVKTKERVLNYLRQSRHIFQP